MRTKVLSAVIAAVLITVGVAPILATGRAEAEGLEDVTLMLDWVPNVNHVGLYVARDRGFFEDEGLRVRIIEPGEVFAAGAVTAGRADYGVEFQENVTLLRADGIPVVSIAALLQTNTSGFATRAQDGITSASQFAGLTYGTFQSPFEEPTLNAIVSCAGGSPAGIRYVPAGNDLLAMLQQRQADLVWIFYGTQGFQAERVGIEIDFFPLNEYTDCLPDYYTPILIASDATLENHPDRTRRLLRALANAHEYVIANPSSAAQTLAAAVPELDAGELERSVPWLAQYMRADSAGVAAPVWGHQRAEVWSDYADWMRSVGLLDADAGIDGAFTNAFLPAAE